MNNLYYQPMTDSQFNEVKREATAIWSEYDDTYGYATEKINRIKDLGNCRDNGMFMVGMFDFNNKRKLAEKLSKDTRKAVYDRLVAGGAYEEASLFEVNEDCIRR